MGYRPRSITISELRKLPIEELAKIHMDLTRYIIAMQQGKFREAEHISKLLFSELGTEITNVLQADEIRREIHKVIKERAIEEARKNDTKIVIKAPFVIPDVEAVALSFADKLKYGKVIIDRDSIQIDEHEIMYYRSHVEPVGYGMHISIDKIGNRLELNGEVYGRIGEDIDYEYVIESMSLRDVKKLIDSGELNIDEICREDEYACRFLKKIQSGDFEGLDRYMFIMSDKCLTASEYCFLLSNGEYLNVVYMTPDTEAILIRELGDEAVRFPIVEKLRSLGLDAYVDYIYHAAEDIGAEAGGVVHIAFHKDLEIKSAEDEVKAAREIERILNGIAKIWKGM